MFVVLSAMFVVLSAMFVVLLAMFVVLSAMFVVLLAIFVVLSVMFAIQAVEDMTKRRKVSLSGKMHDQAAKPRAEHREYWTLSRTRLVEGETNLCNQH